MAAADVFVLGYCEDTRVLVELLRVEAPAMLARLVIVEPDRETARVLAEERLHVRHAPVADAVALGRLVAEARLVVCFAPERTGWPPDVLHALLVSFAPSAHVFVHGVSGAAGDAPSGAVATLGPPPASAAPAGLVARLASWRLWLLVVLTAVDAVVFFLPVTATALLVAAVVAPRRLRQAAGFLDALATGRGG